MIVLGFSTWGVLALWFRLPAPESIRLIVSGLFGFLGAATVLAQLTRGRAKVLRVFAIVLAGIFVWWVSIDPPLHRDWADKAAEQVTGTIDSETLTLVGVRNFAWRSDGDFTPNWETRTYDLKKLESTDIFMSYWEGTEIAHLMVSFGFEGNEYLTWSAEVRQAAGSGFSAVKDTFKTHTLILIAGDERDLIGLRTNIEGDDVELYRTNASPLDARELLVDYVELSNELSLKPRWYNTVTTNCTTVVVSMVRNLFKTVPMSWRVLLDGHVPEYAYDLGVLDSRLSFDQLQDRSHITNVAIDVGISPNFSSDIRKNVPDPRH